MGSFRFKRTAKKIIRRLPSGRDWLMAAVGAAVVLVAAHAGRQAEPAAKPLASGPVAAVDIAWLPDSVKRWEPVMNEMGRKYDLNPDVLAIIMTLESGGNPRAHSEAGAEGLMQITPPTGGDIAKRYLKQPRSQYDLFDPKTSIEFSAAYLSLLRNEFGAAQQAPSWNSTVELIAAGYNGGPGAASALDKGEGLRDTQTVTYSRDAFNMWRERKAASSPTYQRWLQRGGSRMVQPAAQ